MKWVTANKALVVTGKKEMTPSLAVDIMLNEPVWYLEGEMQMLEEWEFNSWGVNPYSADV